MTESLTVSRRSLATLMAAVYASSDVSTRQAKAYHVPHHDYVSGLDAGRQVIPNPNAWAKMRDLWTQ